MRRSKRPAACSKALLSFCILCVVAAADDALDAGKRAFDAGDYVKAARLFENVREGSSRCDIPFYLGMARYRLKQVDEAIIAFRSAGECDPKWLDAQIALGEAYAKKGDDNRALAAFESALRLQPDHQGALRAAATLYLRHQMNEQAIRVLEKLAGMEKDAAQVRSDLGAAYAATSQFEKAEREFREALRLNPQHPSALTGLGNVCLKTGRLDKAVELLGIAAKLAPAAYEPHFLLGAAYNQKERYEESVGELQQALRLGGTDPEIYYNLARAFRGLGREEERRKALAEFTALKTKSEQETEARREADRLLEQAKPLVDAGDIESAIALLERARALQPDNTRVLFRLAGLYYDVRRYSAAQNYVQEAIELAPSEWLYHYLRGLIEKSRGHWQAARSSLETAARLNPSAADAYNELGDLAMRQNDFPRAIENFERAVKIDPQQAAYKLNLEAARRAVRR